MTAKDAYIEGFRKTAEAYGVDSEKLVKVAVPLAELLRNARTSGVVSEQLGRALSNVGVAKPRLFRLFDGFKTVENRHRTTVYPNGRNYVKKYYSGISRANKALADHHKMSHGGLERVIGSGTPETEYWASLLSGKAPPLQMNGYGEWRLSPGRFGRTVPQSVTRSMFGYRPALQPEIQLSNELGNFKVPFIDRLIAMGYGR